jgi:hypothetical protein
MEGTVHNSSLIGPTEWTESVLDGHNQKTLGQEILSPSQEAIFPGGTGAEATSMYVEENWQWSGGGRERAENVEPKAVLRAWLRPECHKVEGNRGWPELEGLEDLSPGISRFRFLTIKHFWANKAIRADLEAKFSDGWFGERNAQEDFGPLAGAEAREKALDRTRFSVDNV